MRLYKIVASDATIDWAGTQADAKAAVARHSGHPGAPVTWKEEEVPTDKPGLIAWLKVNAVAGE